MNQRYEMYYNEYESLKKDYRNLKDISLVIVENFFNNLGELDLENNKIIFNAYKAKKYKNSKLIFYNTVFHELEHYNAYKQCEFYECSFDRLLSIIEYISYFNENDMTIDKKGLFFNKVKCLKTINKNYDISFYETNSNIFAYKETLKHKELYNNDKQFLLDKLILESYIVFKELNTIRYSANNKVYDKFNFDVINTGNYIKKNNSILEFFKALNYYYNSDGSIKTIYEIYSNRNEINSNCVDEFISNMILSNLIDNDFYKNLNENQFRLYIIRIVKKKLSGIIEASKKIEYINVIIDNEIYKRFVDDNNKILNLKILNIDKVLRYVEKKGRNMI